MEKVTTITLHEEEYEEAILDFINKHSNKNYRGITKLKLLNGTSEERVLFNKITVNVEEG